MSFAASFSQAHWQLISASVSLLHLCSHKIGKKHSSSFSCAWSPWDVYPGPSRSGGPGLDRSHSPSGIRRAGWPGGLCSQLGAGLPSPGSLISRVGGTWVLSFPGSRKGCLR